MKTKIICILDKSGSMSSIISDAIGGFNSFLEEQQQIDEVASMDIILFSNIYEKIVDNIDIREVSKLDRESYRTSGTTALYDAIGRTIEHELDLYGDSPENRPDKTLCVILTDGDENSSRMFNKEKIKLMIEEMKEDFKWDFIFLAANQDACLTADGIGISRGNSMDFSGDSEGIKVAYSSMSSVASYYRTSSVVENSNNLFEDSRK